MLLANMCLSLVRGLCDNQIGGVLGVVALGTGSGPFQISSVGLSIVFMPQIHTELA